MSERFQQNLVLSVSTVAFTICFACWVLNGVLITYLVGTNVFAFSAVEVGWLLAQGCSTLFQRCSNSTICEDVIER